MRTKFQLSVERLDLNSLTMKLLIGLILLSLCLAWPNDSATWFNGLPWSTKLETSIIMVVTPICFLTGWRFLTKSTVHKILILLLLVCGTLSVMAPSSGLSVKVYPTELDFEREI